MAKKVSRREVCSLSRVAQRDGSAHCSPSSPAPSCSEPAWTCSLGHAQPGPLTRPAPATSPRPPPPLAGRALPAVWHRRPHAAVRRGRPQPAHLWRRSVIGMVCFRRCSPAKGGAGWRPLLAATAGSCHSLAPAHPCSRSLVSRRRLSSAVCPGAPHAAPPLPSPCLFFLAARPLPSRRPPAGASPCSLSLQLLLPYARLTPHSRTRDARPVLSRHPLHGTYRCPTVWLRLTCDTRRTCRIAASLGGRLPEHTWRARACGASEAVRCVHRDAAPLPVLGCANSVL